MSNPIIVALGQPRFSQCTYCGKAIFLVKRGKDRYKWVTNMDKPTKWKCNPGRDFPVRGHMPKEWVTVR